MQYAFICQLNYPFSLLKKVKSIKIKKINKTELSIEYNGKVRFLQKNDANQFRCNHY